MFSKIKRTGVIPASWMVQLQWYLMLADAPAGDWVIFCADQWDLITFEIRADKPLHKELIKVAVEFWVRVQNRTPPEPLDIDAKKIEFQAGEGTVKQVDAPEFIEAVSMLRQAYELCEEGETLKQLAKDKVKEFLGDKGKYEGGGVRVHWYERAGNKTFDKKALAQASPLDRQKITRLLLDLFNRGLVDPDGLSACTLDLSQFDKQGKPVEVFTPYFIA
jgi:hypothetical protein